MCEFFFCTLNILLCFQSVNSSLLELEKNVVDIEAFLHSVMSQMGSQYSSSAMLSVEVKKTEDQAR